MHKQDMPVADTGALTLGYLPPFEVSLDSQQSDVRGALSALLAGLGPLALDVEEAGTVELVMAEALNNIVEHAYSDRKRKEAIHIRCKQLRDGLHLRIVDRGMAMPDGKTPIGMAQDINVDTPDMPEGGFGWFLIQDLAKDIRYRRVGHTNQLDLRLAVALHAEV
ncbi:ATP-binding protein [Sulfitobacter sp. M368]|uniref:ATP-binding protein n=1 Tax=Sulfitobacter sp. M368 TaxID=2867021 RepID=UPI0021A344A2|nr:ATP-binding protein [Sulfitobacter sp. M368]